jgi:uncharacterized protein
MSRRAPPVRVKLRLFQPCKGVLMPGIVTFSRSVAPETSSPDPDRLLSGQPQLTLWNHYADETQQFFAGVWEATPGSWRVRYSEHEFCHLLTGRIIITSDTGERSEFAAGDSFVVPAGFSGIWQVLERCRKLYAIFERRGNV